MRSIADPLVDSDTPHPGALSPAAEAVLEGSRDLDRALGARLHHATLL